MVGAEVLCAYVSTVYVMWHQVWPSVKQVFWLDERDGEKEGMWRRKRGWKKHSSVVKGLFAYYSCLVERVWNTCCMAAAQCHNCNVYLTSIMLSLHGNISGWVAEPLGFAPMFLWRTEWAQSILPKLCSQLWHPEKILQSTLNICRETHRLMQ